MKMYTIIFEFLGGTYIKQISSMSQDEAIIEWVNTISTNEIPDLNSDRKQMLKMELDDEINIPVLLDGLKNVFCVSCTIDNEYCLFTIVQTAV